MSSSSTGEPGTARKHAAGAYDVRNVIAALIGFYGVVLVLVGIFGQTEDDRTRTGDVNANLWSGVVMIVVALGFLLWTRLRPIVVDPAQTHADGEGADDGSGTGPQASGH
jgi:hypothetical protein